MIDLWVRNIHLQWLLLNLQVKVVNL
jgi:hypothetical protein